MGIGESYLTTVKPTEGDTIRFSIQIPKKYKKKWGKIICPKCLQKNQTIPIHYEFGEEVITLQINKQSDTTYVSSKDNYYDGGCVHSDFSPQYFCRRDKIKF